MFEHKRNIVVANSLHTQTLGLNPGMTTSGKELVIDSG